MVVVGGGWGEKTIKRVRERTSGREMKRKMAYVRQVDPGLSPESKIPSHC